LRNCVAAKLWKIRSDWLEPMVIMSDNFELCVSRLNKTSFTERLNKACEAMRIGHRDLSSHPQHFVEITQVEKSRVDDQATPVARVL
jgi:hypothetical protein